MSMRGKLIQWGTIRIVLAVFALLASLTAPLTIFAAPPPPSVQAPPFQGPPTVVRAPAGLRLREGPSLTDPIILVLRHGETVYPLGGPIVNQGIAWRFVRVYRGRYYYDGFCASAYLAGTPAQPPTGESGLRVVAQAGLRLRAGPGTQYAIRRIVPYGTVLRPTGNERWSGGLLWAQVSINGVYLWAAKMYLQPV